MKTSIVELYEDNFSLNIGLSVIFHICIVVFFIFRATFWSDENVYFENAIRVDIVGLPEKMQAQQEPAPPSTKTEVPIEKEAPKAEPPKPKEDPKVKPKESEAPKVVLEKSKHDLKSKQADSLAKLKRMESLEKIREEVSREQVRQRVTQYKGNVLSPGTSLTGVNKLQQENYQNTLDSHVKKYWQLPQWLAQKRLTAQIRIRIDSNGNLISKEFIKSSGNPDYDESVLETLKKASPFPRPPEKFTNILEVDGVTLGFPE